MMCHCKKSLTQPNAWIIVLLATTTGSLIVTAIRLYAIISSVKTVSTHASDLILIAITAATGEASYTKGVTRKPDLFTAAQDIYYILNQTHVMFSSTNMTMTFIKVMTAIDKLATVLGELRG
jgi:predicted dinucleotide-binding enzyme